jgi:hypothetical protein
MPRKRNDKLTPQEVKRMGLKEFEQRFGFRPVDALEKQFFAATGKRPMFIQREVMMAEVLGPVDTSDVVMDD